MPARIPVPRTLPRLASGVAVLALGLAGLTACGGGDSGSSSAAGATSESASASSSVSTVQNAPRRLPAPKRRSWSKRGPC